MTPAPPYTETAQPLPPAPATHRTPGMSLFMLCLLCMQIATLVLFGLCVDALTSIRSVLKSGTVDVWVRNSYHTPHPTPSAGPMLVRIDTNGILEPWPVILQGTPVVRVQTGPEVDGDVDAGGEEVPPVETGVADVPPVETGEVLVG